jgi:hypothetical protein
MLNAKSSSYDATIYKTKGKEKPWQNQHESNNGWQKPWQFLRSMVFPPTLSISSTWAGRTNIASYLVAKVCVSQDGSKKVLVGHNGVLYIVQVLSQKDPLLFLWIGQVVSKFLADDEPLAGSIKVSVVLFVRNNR